MNPVADIAGLTALWQRTSGGDPEVKIAIIDGPVDLNHPSLRQARVALGGEFVAPSSPTIQSEHGTHVTSVLMGTPGSPVLGVAPNCSATVFSIYRENAAGQIVPSSQSTLALAINQALAVGADVINISSGQQSTTGQADRILVDAVRACERAGKLIVAAAGNDGCRCVQVPGSLSSVLAVGACDLAGNPLAFSNFGDAYLENGILAPGENIAGASPVRNVSLRSGTSFAAPIVTGVVALLLAIFIGVASPYLHSHEVGNLYERRGQAKPVSALTGLWVFPGIFILIGPIVWFVKSNGALNAYWRSLGAQG